MKNRNSVRALVFNGDSVLLVKHMDPKTGFEFWVPPGGGIEGAETLFDAAVREVREETGLTIKPGKVAYLRQYITRREGHNLQDILILAEHYEGNISSSNQVGAEQKWIKEVRFLSKEELKEVTVFPKALKDSVWDDKAQGFPHMRFLGVDYDSQD